MRPGSAIAFGALSAHATLSGRAHVEELVVAVELVPGGGVITVTLRPGEAYTVPLPGPVMGPDGTEYTAVDITIDRLRRRASLEA
jgi:hypothetical protein